MSNGFYGALCYHIEKYIVLNEFSYIDDFIDIRIYISLEWTEINFMNVCVCSTFYPLWYLNELEWKLLILELFMFTKNFENN